VTLVREIAEWADAQADWMSDAVRRLIAEGQLSEVDRSDLVALIKATAGLPDAEQRTAKRIRLDALPENVDPGVTVCLTGLRNPQNLNAIGFDDGLTFPPSGLTVVYGYNGSGKSGYARALKKACRSRNTEPLLPNVFSPPLPPQPARVRFEWTGAIGDAAVSHAEDWVDGGAAPASLSQIAVFDAHCARVFVDGQAKISFIPYGMDVMRELSACMTHSQETIEKERAAAKFDRSLLQTLTYGDTEVARLVQKLDRKSELKKAEALATLSTEEHAEMEELKKLLSDPETQKKIHALRRLAVRLENVTKELETLAAPLLDESQAKLRVAFNELKAAGQASAIASQVVKNGTLPGTGSDPWEILLKSAADFAEQQAYVGHDFPGPDNASCVLCQQPLSAEARTRLDGFWAFLQGKAQRTYDQKRTGWTEVYTPVKVAAVAVFPNDKTIFEELADSGVDLRGSVSAFVQALLARQAAVLQMVANKELAELVELPTNPQQAIQECRAQFLAQASMLEQGLTPEQRAVKQKRLTELHSRLRLGEYLPLVSQAIESEKRDYLFAEAVKFCNTRNLTQKNNELYERTVTQALQDALERELKALGVSHSISFGMSGQKGVRMQQLRLDATAMPKEKLSGILSEGEQRAIAIASFLAEVSLEPSKSGIVFDDPVTSMDHRRRERIAKRLAQEAKQRQVIVFTHDLAFAWELQQSAEAAGHQAAVRHVYSSGGSKGHCSEKLPFEGQKVKPRLALLKELHQKAKKALEVDQDFDAYNALLRNGYRMLRDTWELLVEDHLFNGVVKRFHRPISTLKLRSVRVEDEHSKAVFDGMSRASNFTHEGGAEAPPVLPEAHEFLADVQQLEDTFNSVLSANKATETRRVELGVPS
jgi:energy-coupling factor transporter ATP-binding protein EcfA2